jgi:hypothetical protein
VVVTEEPFPLLLFGTVMLALSVAVMMLVD